MAQPGLGPLVLLLLAAAACGSRLRATHRDGQPAMSPRLANLMQISHAFSAEADLKKLLQEAQLEDPSNLSYSTYAPSSAAPSPGGYNPAANPGLVTNFVAVQGTDSDSMQAAAKANKQGAVLQQQSAIAALKAAQDDLNGKQQVAAQALAAVPSDNDMNSMDHQVKAAGGQVTIDQTNLAAAQRQADNDTADASHEQMIAEQAEDDQETAKSAANKAISDAAAAAQQEDQADQAVRDAKKDDDAAQLAVTTARNAADAANATAASEWAAVGNAQAKLETLQHRYNDTLQIVANDQLAVNYANSNVSAATTQVGLAQAANDAAASTYKDANDKLDIYATALSDAETAFATEAAHSTASDQGYIDAQSKVTDARRDNDNQVRAVGTASTKKDKKRNCPLK